MHIAPGHEQTNPGNKVLMSTETTYHFSHSEVIIESYFLSGEFCFLIQKFIRLLYIFTWIRVGIYQV